MKLLGDRLLLKPDKMRLKQESGLIIPDAYYDKILPYKKATVVKCGTGTKDEPMIFSDGDRVLYQKDSGDEIIIDEEKYILIRCADIYAREEIKDEVEPV